MANIRSIPFRPAHCEQALEFGVTEVTSVDNSNLRFTLFLLLHDLLYKGFQRKKINVLQPFYVYFFVNQKRAYH